MPGKDSFWHRAPRSRSLGIHKKRPCYETYHRVAKAVGVMYITLFQPTPAVSRTTAGMRALMMVGWGPVSQGGRSPSSLGRRMLEGYIFDGFCSYVLS